MSRLRNMPVVPDINFHETPADGSRAMDEDILRSDCKFLSCDLCKECL